VHTVNTLQHTAPHCNTLHHTATHCNTLHHTATHCPTLHHAATHCPTLHHAATHCTTLHHTVTHCPTWKIMGGATKEERCSYCVKVTGMLVRKGVMPPRRTFIASLEE